MDTLYKVVPIEGKGLGCVALKDIKIGTVILEEKPQMVIEKEFFDGSGRRYDIEWIIDAYNKMNKNDKLRFWKLHNAFELERPDDRHLKIETIFATNNFGPVLGIECSRFNHSCQPNAAELTVGQEVIQIIANSTIKKGQEITLFYGSAVLKKMEERQETFYKKWRFRCNCDRCQKESIDANDEIYARYKILAGKFEQLWCEFDGTVTWDTLDDVLVKHKKGIEILKEVYDIAKKKKVHRLYIINNIIEARFELAIRAYFFIFSMSRIAGEKSDPRVAEFMAECERFAKAGYKISKPFGIENTKFKEYKEKHLNFEEHFLKKFDGQTIVQADEVTMKFTNVKGKRGMTCIPRGVAENSPTKLMRISKDGIKTFEDF